MIKTPEQEMGMDTTAKSISMADEVNQDIEMTTRRWGEKLFELLETAGEPSLLTIKGLYGALMNWAMKDEKFKIQLFRFIDVLPTLRSSGEVARHLSEYLDNDEVKLNPALRAALKATNFAGGLLGGGIKAQVTDMARMFMLGDDPRRKLSPSSRSLNDEGAAFTVDVLGEAVVSEKEADEYAARYLELMDLLARETARPEACPSDLAPRRRRAALERVAQDLRLLLADSPTDPDTAIATVRRRLRPVLRRAKELGAFINFDMESYAVKNSRCGLFRALFAEPEFRRWPGMRLWRCRPISRTARQTCATGRLGARPESPHHRPPGQRRLSGITKRSSRGRRGWPVPVFERKPESDANFEKLSLLPARKRGRRDARLCLAQHPQSGARACAHAERLGLEPSRVEFQVLYGMADAIKSALLQAGCRVRVYCPVGELLPGMAYLVRRLLENTSNEGFLANKFAKGATRDALLRRQWNGSKTAALPLPGSAGAEYGGVPDFKNEPPADFTLAVERARMRESWRRCAAILGASTPW